MVLLRTPTEMFPLVESWQQSGLTQKAFSLQHQLPTHVLVYWVDRYRKSHSAPPDAPSGREASGFLRLSAPACEPLPEMVVELPGGVLIRFSGLVPVAYLQELVRGCSR